MSTTSRRRAIGWVALAAIVVLCLLQSALLRVWSEEKPDGTPAAQEPAAQQEAATGAASAPSAWNPIPRVHPDDTRVGSDQCILCHSDAYDTDKPFRHPRAIWHAEAKGEFGGCEACHGAGSRHVQTVDPSDLLNLGPEQHDNRAQACLVCHAQRSRQQWMEGVHSQAGLDCFSCHVPVNHASPEVWAESETLQAPKADGETAVQSPAEPPFLLRIHRDEKPEDLCFQCHANTRAAFGQYSHHPLTEGRITCTQCHHPHGPGPTEGTGEPVVETCTRCHKEMEGPFVFEHDPISSGLAEGCVTCHNPHGSPNDDLLKLPGRGVCLQCHVEEAVGHFGGPAATCWTSGCHAQVHGSNDSPFFFR